MAMTTIAQRMPAAERAVCVIDHVDETAVSRTEPTRSVSATDRWTANERGQRGSAKTDYAWVEAAAMAGTRTPRG